MRSRRCFCDRLWAAASIRWNGDLEPCACADGEAPLFRLPETSFAEAWNSEPYRETRRYLIAAGGGATGPDLSPGVFEMCRVCPVPMVDRYLLARWRLKGVGAALRLRARFEPSGERRRLFARKAENWSGLVRSLRRPGADAPFAPVHANVDLTNRCNLQCPMCLVGSGEIEHPRGRMAPERFEALMAEIGETLVHLEFYRYGEPLLHPDAPGMVELAARRYGCDTRISSNLAMPLPVERVEALVRAGLGTLVVAADGEDQETYEKYRRGGRAEIVFENVRAFAAARRRLGRSRPRILWQCLVFRHNAGQIDAIRRAALRAGADRFVAVEPSIPRYDAAAEWVVDGAARDARDEKRARQICGARVAGPVVAGGTFAVETTVANTTRTTWQRSADGQDGVRLGVKLYDAEGTRFLHELGRGFLGRDLAPGESASVRTDLPAPQGPGRYRLKLDMLREGAYWYEWKTGERSEPAWVDLTVAPAED